MGTLSVLGDGGKLWWVIEKLTRSTLQFLGRDSSHEVEFQEPTSPSSRVHILTQEINRLANEVTKTLNFLEERPRHIIHSAGFPTATLVNLKTIPVVLGTILGAFVVKRFFGVRILGLWYVTRSCFVATTEKWLNSIHALSITVNQFYNDMHNHTFLISKRIEENKEGIKQQIEINTEKCKRDISIVTDDLFSVRESLWKVSLTLDNMHGSLALTNKGIEMLCGFVLQRTRSDSLESAFIEQRIYRELTDMTNCLQWEEEEKRSPHKSTSSPTQTKQVENE